MRPYPGTGNGGPMPRRTRKDYPGALHHVMDRAIARRTLFEKRVDVRRLLAALARQVRSGDLEIHAYAILTTHFHLLVGSPTGQLSSAMQRALDAYARWFNRSRRRDGPLFRGRFVNWPIESDAYLLQVLRYIDDNPVEAGLSPRPAEYPYGSAWHYARPKGPRWMTRSLVESLAGRRPGEPWVPENYGWFNVERPSPDARWVVETRILRGGGTDDDPLDDLVGVAPAMVRDWMERKAQLADGIAVGEVIVSPELIRSRARLREELHPGRVVEVGRRRAPLTEVIAAGLYRQCSGLRWDDIAERLRVARSTAQQRHQLFRLALRAHSWFAQECAKDLQRALAKDDSSAVRMEGPPPRERRPLTIDGLDPLPEPEGTDS